MDSNVIWLIITVASNFCSIAIGAVARAWSERLKLVSQRDLSERDLWQEIGGLKADLKQLREQLTETERSYHELDKKHAALDTAHQILRKQHEDLGKRYDRLRKDHDALLRGRPLEGPSPVPGGDQP